MDCQCAICKNKIPFDLPNEIIDAVTKGDMVIFSGAGISTEKKTVYMTSFYEDVYAELNIDKDLDFPSLMTLYCSQVNGRKKLLEKIQQRFEYVHQFDELYRTATSFHEELSSIYQIDNIFTTNWDDFFERKCNAVPIVTAEDFAFYNVAERKVFKIHGSISNYGSIVATKEDYNNCYKNLKEGIIGSYLKTVLATKVVVFIGFSFNDFDFNKIYNYLKEEMKEVLPQCYVVTIDGAFKKKFLKEKATVIQTDGSYFIKVLREHLEGTGELIRKSSMDKVYSLRYYMRKVHESSSKLFLKYKNTVTAYNLCYQDGINHAFDSLIHNAKSGKTFNPEHVLNTIKSYEYHASDFYEKENYTTYSYIEGYVSALYTLVTDKDYSNKFPFFFVIGKDFMYNLKDFKSILKKGKVYDKKADKKGKKDFKNMLKAKSDIVIHHRPFIF